MGQRAIDLLGPAFLAFKGQEGEMRFIALTAWLDIAYDARKAGRSRTSPERATTKASSAPAAAGSHWEPPDALSAISTSTAATVQASSANNGEFFNGLLVRISHGGRAHGGVGVVKVSVAADS